MVNTLPQLSVVTQYIIQNLDERGQMYNTTNRFFEGPLGQYGDRAEAFFVPNLTLTTGGTAGDDITATDYTIQKEQIIMNQTAHIRLKIKDIEVAQMNIEVARQLGGRIGQAWIKTLEAFLASFALDAHANNILGSSGYDLTATGNATNALDDLQVALDEFEVEMDGRNVFLEPKACSLLKKDAKFDGTDRGLEMRMKGYIGEYDGFKIFKTNSGPSNKMFVLPDSAVNTAIQINNIETTRAEAGFYDNLKLEAVYGGKVFGEDAKRLATYEYAPL